MMIGRLSFGLLLDRIFAPHLTALVFLAPTVAFSVLLLPDTTSINAMIAAGFLGFGLGAEVDALSYIASRSFGLRYFGRILGFLMVAFTLGLAFGPILFGKIYDQFQSYQLALWIAAGISAVSSGIDYDLTENRPAKFTSGKSAHSHAESQAQLRLLLIEAGYPWEDVLKSIEELRNRQTRDIPDHVAVSVAGQNILVGPVIVLCGRSGRCQTGNQPGVSLMNDRFARSRLHKAIRRIPFLRRRPN